MYICLYVRIDAVAAPCNIAAAAPCNLEQRLAVIYVYIILRILRRVISVARIECNWKIHIRMYSGCTDECVYAYKFF